MFDKIRYRCVFNRSGKLNKDGRSVVQVECLLNGKRVYFSTKVYLFPYQWDGHYVVNHPLEKELNRYIFNEVIKIQRIEFSFIERGKNPTLKMLKNAVRSNGLAGLYLVSYNRVYPIYPEETTIWSVVKDSTTRTVTVTRTRSGNGNLDCLYINCRK